MEGAGAMQPANAELRKPEIGAQFVSFNFTNALIWGVGSSFNFVRARALLLLDRIPSWFETRGLAAVRRLCPAKFAGIGRHGRQQAH
jgi:hypothetical protein